MIATTGPTVLHSRTRFLAAVPTIAFHKRFGFAWSSGRDLDKRNAALCLNAAAISNAGNAATVTPL